MADFYKCGPDCPCGSDPAVGIGDWNPVNGPDSTSEQNDPNYYSIIDAPFPPVRTTTAKLKEWDANADFAFDELLTWVQKNRDELLAVARGRHVWGHFRYQDRNYYEYDLDRLTSETSEEIADAINYFTRRRVLREGYGT